MRKMTSKDGVSIAEVVIALSIIVVVSMTALTLVLSSFSVRSTLITRTQGINFADNAWECFKAADDAREFESLVKEAESELTLDGNTGYEYDYSYQNDRFEANIIVTYEVGKRPTFDIVVTENKVDGDEIISFKYVKGGKYYENP